MANERSFKDFVEARYEDELWSAVASFIEENPEKIECHSYSVSSPDEATLADLRVKSVSIRDTGGTGIKFDVIVETELEIAETVSRYRKADNAEQWFRISCSGDLDDGLHNFAVTNVSVYNEYDKIKQDTMSNALVPYIYKDNLENVAEKFLKRYYPKALEVPMPLPVLEVANNMGLTVKAARLSKNCTVFGEIVFVDCQLNFYDETTKQYIPRTVKKGTIFHDPNVFFMRNLGCVNNTIIHECVHGDKHKKAFELQKLYNEKSCTIRCQVLEGTKPDEKRSPADWMEWQANVLAPRILMPYQQAGLKAKELIEKNKRMMQTDNTADVIETVIVEMAEFFSVSKASAKIRMIDLGYEEAIGAFTYMDDHYVPTYSFAPGTLKKNQTFVIGTQDALFEYASNPELRRMVDSGKYLYVDSHYCINDPKYIRENEYGHPELTDYANKHADECCLVFDLEAKANKSYGIQYYTECVLYRDAASSTHVEAKYKHNAQNQEVEARAEEISKFSSEVKNTADIMRRLPATFSGTLTMLMKWKKCTVQALADRSLVSEKSIQRMRNDKQDAKLGTIVALCIGLQLQPAISEDLIKKAGYSFKVSEEHIAYQYLLASCYKSSIYECNELLEAEGLRPIGREE